MSPPERPSDETLAALVRDAPVEPVDELTRRRMIARAIEAADVRARRLPDVRRLRVLAAAAAAVVALGVVSALVALSGGGGRTAQLATEGEVVLPIGEDQVALDAGALDDPGRLHSTLLAGEEGTTPEAGGGGGGGEAGSGADAPGGAATPQAPAAATATPSRAPIDEGTLAALGRCYHSLAGSVPETNALTAAATGTYRGEAVVVLGFRSPGDRLLAIVLARDDCTILSAQSFK